MRSPGALALCAAMTAFVPVARAQGAAPSRPGRGSVLDAALGERAAALRIHAEARARLLAALDGHRDDALGPSDDTLLEQAILRYEVVLDSSPEDVDAWLEQALALTRFHRVLPDGSVVRRTDEAIASLERARLLAPDREEGWVAFELAVLHTGRHDYAAAAREYARALDASTPYPTALEHSVSHTEEILVYLFAAPGEASILGNWAEVLMLGGEPERAIETYSRAFTAAPAGSAAAALALWGRALAEERAGRHADAVRDAGGALDADPVSRDGSADAALRSRHGAFAVLHLSGVFFEPACEIHAYEALGHEALAARAPQPDRRATERALALRSTRYFLAEGGRDSAYATTAQRAEARLAAETASPALP